MKLLLFGCLMALFIICSSNIRVDKRQVDVSKSTVTWRAKKFTGEHNGTVRLQSGTLEILNGILTGGNFVIDMKSITNTDIKDDQYRNKLIGHLKSADFFGVEKFPVSDFIITKTKVLNGNKYQLDGKLTIKGITRNISFPAYVNISAGQLVAKADIVVDRSKYDIKFKSSSFFDSLGDSVIYDNFEVSVLLYAK